VTVIRSLVAVALVACTTAGAAHASAASAVAPGPTLALVSQDLLVGPGGAASFTFTVSGTVPDDAEVVVEAYTKLASAQQDFGRLLNNQLHNRDVGFVATSLNLLTPDALGRYTVALPTVTAPQQRVLGGNALMPDPGMYPVTIELRADNVALAQLVSAVVRTADPTAGVPPPLDVALVFPLGGTPTLRADGSTIVEPVDRARLQTVANVLTASATPLTVVPQPELIDGLARTGLPADAALRAALAAGISGRQVLASPYVTMDPTAAVRAGLGDELTRELTEGEDALAAALPTTTTDRTTWVADRNLDGDAVAVLRELGVRHLVVPADAVGRPSGASSPSPSTTAVDIGVAGDSLPVQAATADPALAGAFGRRDDPVLAAYQFVATLLAAGLDHPSAPARQGLVVLPPSNWQPDPTFLATVTALVGRVPLLHAVTLDRWFREVTVDTGGARPLAPAAPADLGSYATGLVLTRARLTGLASMLAAGNPLPDSLELRLRVASAAVLAPAARQSYLDAVNAELNNLANAVDPIPTRRITLASRSTEVPITLHRRLDAPIQVRLHLESPKLSFPENDILVTLDSETVQERITVRARANGTFPLTVQVTTPQGDIPLAPSAELTVHATTLSGFGVVLTVGALLVLATWWVRHLRRTRRQKATAASALHHPSAGAVPSH
jgi:hypothetical protein